MQKVKDWSQVEKNIIEFNINLGNEESEARKRFTSFSHWYYHPRLNFFSPSKFIGYQNTTHDNYQGDGSGGITQNALSPFFNPIPFNSEEYRYYLSKLLIFATENNLKISKKTLNGKHGGLYLPKSNYVEENGIDVLIEKDSNYIEQCYERQLTGKEGKENIIQITRYERDPKLRKEAILIHGTKCVVCNFDFEAVYGLCGKGYIEVHHLTPLSIMEKEEIINPKTDMVTICSNCHRMVHRFQDKILSIAELQKSYQTSNNLREGTK